MNIWQPTSKFRVLRDDNIAGAFMADFRKPDRLQQAWQCVDDGKTEWRDIEVVKLSDEFVT